MSIQASPPASELAHQFIDYFSQALPPPTTTPFQPLLNHRDKSRLKSELCCEIENSKMLGEVLFENSNDVSCRIGSFSFQADVGYWNHDDYPELFFSIVEGVFVRSIRIKARSANKLASRQMLWTRVQPFIILKISERPRLACLVAQKVEELGELEAEKEFWERIFIEINKNQDSSRILSTNVQILANEIIRFMLEYELGQEKGQGYATIDLTGKAICIHELWSGCRQNRWLGVRRLAQLFALFSPNIFETYYVSKGIDIDFKLNRSVNDDVEALRAEWNMAQQKVKIESCARSRAILTFNSLGWFSSEMDSDRSCALGALNVEELQVFYKIYEAFSLRSQSQSITVSRGVPLHHSDCNLERPRLSEILTSLQERGYIVSWSPYLNEEELFRIWL